MEKNNKLLVPTAVIVVGMLVAGAVMLSENNNTNTQTQESKKEARSDIGQKERTLLDAVAPVTEKDHILGSPNALVKIVEYSDFECPFCKNFHNTMTRIIDEYGDSGEVAWVYRQTPLEQLHPMKAMREAVASECAADIGGKDAFWLFANRLFGITPSNNRTDIAVLSQIAKKIGLNVGLFEVCLESTKFDEHIAQDIQNFVDTGGRGTPWSILIAPNGDKYPINGAQSYESVKQLIEIVLTK